MNEVQQKNETPARPSVSAAVSGSAPTSSSRLMIPKERMCNFSGRICRRPCRKSSFNYCEIHMSLTPPSCALSINDQSSDGVAKQYAQCHYVVPKTSKQCCNPAVTGLESNSSSTSNPIPPNRQFCQQHKIKYLAVQRKKHSQHRNSKAIVNKYSQNILKYKANKVAELGREGEPGVNEKETILLEVAPCSDAPNGESETNQDGRHELLPVRFRVEESDQWLESYDYDSDEEMVDSLPISKFQPDVIENDVETQDITNTEPLKNACIYTSEELGTILVLKMKRLQQLYKQQFKFLEYDLKCAHVDYLKQMKDFQSNTTRAQTDVTTTTNDSNNNEQELRGRCPITGSRSSGSAKELSETIESREEIKFLKSMRRHKGQEALLKIKMKEKKRIFSLNSEENADMSNSTNITAPSAFQPKCSFVLSKGGVKCGHKTIPKSRYCFKHILSDKNQVLFSQCPVSNEECKKCPTIVVPHVNSSLSQPLCFLHRKLESINCSVPVESIYAIT